MHTIGGIYNTYPTAVELYYNNTSNYEYYTAVVTCGIHFVIRQGEDVVGVGTVYE